PIYMATLSIVHIPFALEQRERVLIAVFHAKRIDLQFKRARVESRTRDPAGDLVGKPVERDLGPVLVLEAVLQDLELQRADGAEDRVLHAQAALREDLDRAFLAELQEAFLQLLALERVLAAHAREDLRRKPRQLGELERRPFAERVADTQRASVEQADHVARPGLLDDDAVRTEQLVRHGEADGPLLAHVTHVHAAAELPAAHPHEGEAVAVRRVHVRLDLEDETAEAFVERIDRGAVGGMSRRRRRSELRERAEEL